MRIFIPKKELVIPVNTHVGLRGLISYKLYKEGHEDSPRISVPPYQNIIVNTGLNNLSGSSIGVLIQRCRVGTGTSEPTATDTGLENQLAATTSNAIATEAGMQDSISPYYGYYTSTHRFTTGTAAGNLTELGFFQSSGNVMFSRQLFRDINGDPTTLVVASDEILDVTYTVQVFPPVADVTIPDFTIGTFTRDLTIRTMSVLGGSAGNTGVWADGFIGSGNTAMALRSQGLQTWGTSVSTVASISAIVGSRSSYTTNSFSRAMTATWQPGTGTSSNINSVYYFAASSNTSNATCGFQCHFGGGALVKTADDRMTFQWQATWGRFDPDA